MHDYGKREAVTTGGLSGETEARQRRSRFGAGLAVACLAVAIAGPVGAIALVLRGYSGFTGQTDPFSGVMLPSVAALLVGLPLGGLAIKLTERGWRGFSIVSIVGSAGQIFVSYVLVFAMTFGYGGVELTGEPVGAAGCQTSDIRMNVLAIRPAVPGINGSLATVTVEFRNIGQNRLETGAGLHARHADAGVSYFAQRHDRNLTVEQAAALHDPVLAPGESYVFNLTDDAAYTSSYRAFSPSQNWATLRFSFQRLDPVREQARVMCDVAAMGLPGNVVIRTQ